MQTLNRRRFLKGATACALAPARLPGDVKPAPRLRAIASYISTSPDVRYFFAFDPVKFYRNIDVEMRAAKQAGFNTLYALYNPYRSEDGQPTPWQDDIPLHDPDFASVAAPTPAGRDAEARMFRNVLAACRKHDLKFMFNVGCWTPQKWFRENPEAISRLPDGSPQYDAVFARSFQRQILTPCFRSPRFLSYTETILRAWLNQYRSSSDFQAVLTRARIADQFEIHLDASGFPVFFIHQDTVDRNWCHCARCRRAFRDSLLARYEFLDHLNHELRTAFRSPEEISIPLSPNIAGSGLTTSPDNQRLWYEAAEFWSTSIEGWRARVVRTLREVYPDAEVAMISKYTRSPFLTDYPLIARRGKLFLMDSYPMEGGRVWNLPRYFFDIEVYQSAAAQQGQALIAHLQAYHNRMRNIPSRAPSPEEFRQQHIGLIARRVGATVTFAFDHVVRLSSPQDPETNLRDSMAIAAAWNKTVAAIELAYRGARPYPGGITVRYNPLASCNPKGAVETLARYRYWKDRGVPVRVVWDQDSAAESVPGNFEFQLEGTDVADMDLVISKTESGYLVSLINMRSTTRKISLCVRLRSEDMNGWGARSIYGPEVTTAPSSDALGCKCALSPLGCAVLALERM
jgi:hypothetical protein